MKFFSDIRLLVLAVWLGAAVFFIAVAQSAFAVLPEREHAGAVVNRTLAILNIGGVVLGGILLVSSFVASARVNQFWLWTERLLIALMIAACAVGQFVIGLWLSAIRAQMGRSIDEVPIDDPLRLQFNALHDYSQWALMAAMTAALITFFIIANRKFSGREASPADPYDFSKEFKV